MTTTIMDGSSLDISAQRKQELKQLFPSVFTETRNDAGEIVETLDFERLKAELGSFSEVYDNRRERYGMEWPGKRDCLRLIQEPSRATLKPCREESVDFDNTENIFIEGDNLEVLKLLQKSYYGQVKMIYIDPPYNTGKEFIYPDNFSENLDTYLEYAGLKEVGGEGKKWSSNSENEGRFHTKWLNMMYPRLYLARNLLREDGVIFISIDDNEVESLRRLCDEIFGEENFVAQMIWEGAFKNDARQIGVNHEYVLVFARNRSSINGSWNVRKEAADTVLKEVQRLKNEYGEDFESASKDLAGWFKSSKSKPWFAHRRFNKIDKHGAYKDDDPTAPGGRKFELINPITNEVIPLRKNRGWTFDQDTFNRLVEDGKISFTSPTSVMLRRYFHETDTATPQSVFYQPARSASERLGKLLEPNIFDFPKDETVIQQFIQMVVDDGDIVLDFFAGSGSTGHACMLEELKENVKIRCILVQLPEPCIEGSYALKAGYKIVSDIAKERIRRAGQKIRTEFENQPDSDNKSQPDLGFKVLKLDQSNFKQWQAPSKEVSDEDLLSQMELLVQHVEPNVSQEDLLYELLIKAGIMPTEKIEVIELAGQSLFSVAEGTLLIHLAETIKQPLIDAILEQAPSQFICLDSAFHGNDQLKANTVQTFNAYNQSRDKIEQIEFKTV
ncbi:site-specific DNA-methyltransferase [Vibrio alginolyticus]